MSLGEYAPLSESKRPCVPRPALFALFGALLWAVVGLTATLATLSAAEVEVTAVEAIVPPGRCDHAAGLTTWTSSVRMKKRAPSAMWIPRLPQPPRCRTLERRRKMRM